MKEIFKELKDINHIEKKLKSNDKDVYYQF
jgi:hypothetical protein